jgi:DHA1 family tetracycline resistance protein-like MFS transporter
MGFAMYGGAGAGSLFLLGIPLGALWGLAAPPLQSMMTRCVDATQQGRLQGAISSLRGIGGMMGPLVFTQTLAWAIRPGARVRLPGAPYLLACALLVIAALASWRLPRAFGRGKLGLMGSDSCGKTGQ